jgi:imidazolonepropionase-like amidohydrolase
MRYSCYALLMLAFELATPSQLHAQRPSPASAQTKSMLVRGGTVHVGDGRVIDDGAVGFRNGKIDFVGYAYGVQGAYDSVINATGQQVYPGFILANSSLGLGEIDQVRATLDLQEVGPITPEARATAAYNTDGRILPTVRSNGVLLAQITPGGNLVSGTSGIVQLDAWDNGHAVVVAQDGLHITWPKAFERQGHWTDVQTVERGKDSTRREQLKRLEDLLARAQAYAQGPRDAVDLRLEAAAGLWKNNLTLYVHADRAREMQEAVLLAKRLGIKRMVIVGGYDAWRIADLLRENNVSVVLGSVHRLPERDDEPVDLPYRIPTLLKERGVRFCLGHAGDMERANARNLPFTAGTAAAHGLGLEEALMSISLHAAQILGIDAHYGSLAVGKSATLFISQGNALDVRGNRLTDAFIDGRHISLENHQQQLYEQYRRRYAADR